MWKQDKNRTYPIMFPIRHQCLPHQIPNAIHIFIMTYMQGGKLPRNPLTCTIVEKSNSRDENNPKHHHGVPQSVNNYFLTHSSCQFKLKPAACQNTETTSTNSNQTSKCHLQGLSLISIANFNRFASKSKLPSSNKGHAILGM
jgi:hypothetical protein